MQRPLKRRIRKTAGARGPGGRRGGIKVGTLKDRFLWQELGVFLIYLLGGEMFYLNKNGWTGDPKFRFGTMKEVCLI